MHAHKYTHIHTNTHTTYTYPYTTHSKILVLKTRPRFLAIESNLDGISCVDGNKITPIRTNVLNVRLLKLLYTTLGAHMTHKSNSQLTITNTLPHVPPLAHIQLSQNSLI